MFSSGGLRTFMQSEAHRFARYNVEYKTFQNGEFGDLERLEFNSEHLGGGIDVWSHGDIMFHLVNYDSGEELINVWIKPDDLAQEPEVVQRHLATLMAAL